MECIYKNISLDIHKDITSQLTLSVKQGDTARGIRVALTDHGRVFKLPDGCYAVFSAKKSNGIYLSDSCVIQGDTIIYNFSDSVVSVAAQLDCELTVYSAKGERITSPSFMVFVYKTIDEEYAGEVVESNDFTVLQDRLEETATAIEAAKKATEDANDAADETRGWMYSISLEEGTGEKSIQQVGNVAIGDYSFARGSGYADTEMGGEKTVSNEALGRGSTAEGAGTRTGEEGEGAHAEGSVGRVIPEDDAEYRATMADQRGAHAEGCGTIADGKGAHSEGYATDAIAEASHAEGKRTKASGEAAHAEGRGIWDGDNRTIQYTEASGEASHAEGRGTLASNKASHAEGYKTEASGEASHAEGVNSKASGNHAHVEGADGIASGANSHCEGWTNIASGGASHAEGEAYEHTNKQIFPNKAEATASHVEGMGTKAKGIGSHAEGGGQWNKTTKAFVYTTADGKCSHAEGTATTAEGSASHSEGVETQAIGNASHAEGVKGQAIGENSHAEGADGIAGGKNSHVEGWGCITTIDAKASHAGGEASETHNYAAFAHGIYTKATEIGQFVVGLPNEEDPDAVFIVGAGEYNPYPDLTPISRVNAMTVTKNGTVEASKFVGDLNGKADTADKVNMVYINSLANLTELAATSKSCPVCIDSKSIDKNSNGIMVGDTGVMLPEFSRGWIACGSGSAMLTVTDPNGVIYSAVYSGTEGKWISARRSDTATSLSSGGFTSSTSLPSAGCYVVQVKCGGKDFPDHYSTVVYYDGSHEVIAYLSTVITSNSQFSAYRIFVAKNGTISYQYSNNTTDSTEYSDITNFVQIMFRRIF